MELAKNGEHTPLLEGSGGRRDSGEVDGSKKINLLSCISVALSMMTGVGIFIFPNLVLQGVNSGGASLLVWTGAGGVALLGGLAYAELALTLPGSGGELVYVLEVFGAVPANLFVLTSAFIKYPAITIIMTRSVFTYSAQFVDSSISVSSYPYPQLTSVTGIVIIVISCVIAIVSTRVTTSLLNAFNICKLSGIAGILGFAIYVAATDHGAHDLGERFSVANTSHDVPAILVGLFGAIASYEGWNSLNLVAGEVHDPARTMPAAIIMATLLAIILYVLCNVAYLTVLPLDVMKRSSAVALDLGYIAFGRYGELFLTICVVASCLATILAMVLCNSRLIQSAARDGQVPRVLRFTWITRQTPLFAIILHGLVCCIFSLITTLDALVTMTVFVSWLFYAFCFVAVVVLRLRKNAKKPSFYVPLVVPIFLTLFSVLLMICPVTTTIGNYRSSFYITLILLAVLTPLSILCTMKRFTDLAIIKETTGEKSETLI
eukprot:sb/3464174/